MLQDQRRDAMRAQGNVYRDNGKENENYYRILG